MTFLILASNPFFSAYSEADLFGKLIFLSLYALSAVCWIVLIYKLRCTRRVKQIASVFREACEKNKNKILQFEVQESHPFASLFRSIREKTVEVLNKNHFFSPDKTQVFLSRTDLELVESYALTEISKEKKELEKHLFILSTIVTLAPFLGLLGTVWGILITFGELHAGSAASSNSAMLGGLSTALATTVLGLVIAIPALIAYNFLRAATRDLTAEMEDFLYQTLADLELQYRKVEA